jgi:hypothetical protein
LFQAQQVLQHQGQTMAGRAETVRYLWGFLVLLATLGRVRVLAALVFPQFQLIMVVAGAGPQNQAQMLRPMLEAQAHRA